jgi:subtilisin family serine protease
MGAICIDINGARLNPPPPQQGNATHPPPQRAAAAANDDSPFEPDEVLVEISGQTAQQIANRLINAFGLVTLSQTRLNVLGTSLFRFRIPPSRTVEDVVALLALEPGVTTSQPNWRYRLNDGAAAPLPPAAQMPAITPERTTLPQYALDLIEARKAHELARGTNILIAVIDTGIEGAHPEIAGAIAGQFNTFPSQTIVPDTHATAIASIITAKQNLSGVAPGARILSVQAFTSTSEKSASANVAEETSEKHGGGKGTSHRVIAGLDWSLMKGAHIVNMSFSGPSLDALAGKLIERGRQSGVIFIAAAGNGGHSAPPAFPAADPAVIAVTAIDARKNLYVHANVGPYIDVAAPGVDVMAAATGATYDLASGTSFAAAHVSAVAALILEKSPGMSQDQFIKRLKESSLDLGPTGDDDQFGAGCINALRALLGLAVQTSGSRQ